MSAEPDNRTKEALRAMLEMVADEAGANNYTCHAKNHRTETIWLFQADTRPDRIRYPYQVHGPLTHPEQRKKFEVLEQSGAWCDNDGRPAVTLTEGIDVWIYDKMSDALKKRALEAPSFVMREEVKWTVKVRLWDPTRQPDSVESGCEAVIFFNFRRGKPVQADALREQILMPLKLLREVLLPALNRPHLSPDAAWLLRNLHLWFRKQLELTLVLRGNALEEKAAELFRTLVEKIHRMLAQLLEKTAAKPTDVSLALVKADNTVEVKGEHPPRRRSKPRPSDGGIINYVARSGQIFLIENVAAYERRRSARRGGKTDLSLPRYQRCNTRSRAELACPLVVQGRVVGVINVEADKPGAFGYEHALLLYMISTIAALGVRQIMLYKDLDTILAQHQQLLRAADRSTICKTTVQSVIDLGYSYAAIWDEARKQWHYAPGDKQGGEPVPRADGYTRRVIQAGQPLVVTNQQANRPAETVSQMAMGQLNQETGYFEKFHPLAEAPCPPSKAFLKRASRNSVRTNLAFPIFRHSEKKTAARQVEAVLWVECARDFSAILLDEFWALTVLCRNVGDAIQFAQARLSADEQVRLNALGYHFGPVMAQEISRHPDHQEHLKPTKRLDQIIVLNIDVRGSTKLGTNLHDRPRQYMEVISHYHHEAWRSIIEHDGVFDKTIGDGIMALWNVFRSGALNAYSRKEKFATSAVAAVRCVRAIFADFHVRWRHSGEARKNLAGRVPKGFGLGAALSAGSGMVGDPFGMLGNKFVEFSVLGTVANHAGKLVDHARFDTVREIIRSAGKKQADLFVWSRDQRSAGWRDPSERELNELRGAASSSTMPALVLLTGAAFDNALKTVFNKVWRLPHPGDDGELVFMPDPSEFSPP